MPARRPLLLRPLILLAAGALLLAHAWWYRAYVSDDAYISLRYARRLLDGDGLTWSDGERVEGYSNLAWLLACALLGRLGLDLVVAARLLGVVCSGAAVWLSARAQRSTAGFALTALAIAVAGPIAVWTAGGLEPPMQAAWLAWAVAGALSLDDDATPARALRAGLPLFGLVLTRPDGLLLATALAAGLLLARRAWAAAAALLAPAVVAALGQLAFRVAYYHAWLPNTAWAKLRLGLPTLRLGLAYLGDGALGLAGLLVLGAAGLALGPRRRTGIIGLPLLVWLAYVAMVGGDFMPGHRYLVPAVVLLAFAAGEAGSAAMRFGRDGRIRLGLAAAVALGWFGLTQLYDPENLFAHGQLWARDGLRLGELFRRGLGARRPLLALDAAGAIAYAARLPALDMLGLCDAWIAHHPPPRGGSELPGHALGDGDYVLRRAPDLVVFNGPAGGAPKFPSGVQMRADPRFAAYERVTFADDGLRAQVYVRRHGRAGIDERAPLELPGWLFANAPGNLARLDDRGQLVGELRAPATVRSDRPGVRLDHVEPADAAVAVAVDAAGAVSVRPSGAGPVQLRAVVLR